MDGPRLAAGLSQRLQSGLEQVGVVRESSSNARVACPTESRGNSQADWRRTRSRSGVAGNFSTPLGALAIEFGQNAIVLASEAKSAQLRVYRDDWRGRVDNEANLVWTGS